MHAAHEKLGIKLKGSRKGVHDARVIQTIADTGCQTCTAGPELLEELRCPDDYLIQCSHRIVGITHDSLNILGAVCIRFEHEDKTSRQMVYISKNIRGTFLSRTALEDLGVISRPFPTTASESPSQAFKCGDIEAKCTCPERTPTPARPEEIPITPSKENVPKLKEWMLAQFASSAFNTCTYQPLQQMDSPPVKVTFKESVQPHAVHTPIQVPVH